MPDVPLSENVPVFLDASGNGTAKAGPVSARETWFPDVVSVSVATNNAEATARMYAGDDTSQRNFKDGTLSGSTGDSTDRVKGPIGCGQYVFAVWAGGDPGAQAMMLVTGTRRLA